MEFSHMLLCFILFWMLTAPLVGSYDVFAYLDPTTTTTIATHTIASQEEFAQSLGVSLLAKPT